MAKEKKQMEIAPAHKANTVRKLDVISKVLKRPARYIGSNRLQNHKRYIFDPVLNKIILKDISSVPGLIKIFKEPLDNTIDEAIRTNFEYANKVQVNIDEDGTITILDNGRGIPSSMGEDEHQKPTLIADLCWCHLDAGANFDDEEDNSSIGQNGEGVCLTNIFSKSFIGETSDKKILTIVDCKNNLGIKNITQKEKKSKESYTQVKFLPDYEKFGVTNISDYNHIDLILFDLITCSVNYPKIDFYFNDKLIKYTFEEFMSLLDTSTYEMFRYRGIDFAVYPSDDDFQFIHFINGINVNRGGTALEWVTDSIVDELRSKLNRQHKGIKPSDIKNKLGIVAIFYGMFNPRFEDQAKTICETNYTQFKTQIDPIDFSKVGDRVYKNKSIIDPIIKLFQAKNLVEELKAAKDVDKIVKKRIVDKYKPAFKKKKGLIISEGDSAVDSVVANVGRDNYGFLAASGVPLNSLEMKIKDVQKSEKFLDVASVLGIEFSKDPKTVLEYEEIILTMDADHDGSHIIGLFLAFFYKFCPHYLFNKKIFIFRTPVAMVKDKNEKTVEVFLTQEEFETFLIKQEKKPNPKLKTEMKKGLGSLSKKEWKEFFEIVKLEDAIEPLEIKDPENFEELLLNWLGEDITCIDYRKEQIINHRNKRKEEKLNGKKS